MAIEAIAFIERHKDQPFFLNYWAFSVHGPWDGKRQLIDKYAKKANPSNPQRLPVYGAMVESLDDAVGRLLDTLDRLKLSQKTIIVFFSDNGGNMYSRVDGIPPTSNAPLRGGKAMIYEGGTRVPCAVVWPGKTPAGSKTDALLSSTDWYPTLLEMLQIEKPEAVQFDGLSQVPTLLGKSGPRESLICFVPNYYPKPGTIPSTYIRRGPWKLIRFHGDGPAGADRFELYNLVEDVGETRNVAAANPDLVKLLNTEISDYLVRAGAKVPVANPAYNSNAKPAERSPTAQAKPNRNRPDPETFFKRRDVNRDGFVTLEEYIGNPVNRNVPALTKQFRRRDANNDSRLTLEEMKNEKKN